MCTSNVKNLQCVSLQSMTPYSIHTNHQTNDKFYGARKNLYVDVEDVEYFHLPFNILICDLRYISIINCHVSSWLITFNEVP